MAQTYTPSTGLTPQGQQLDLTNSNMRNMSSGDLGQLASTQEQSLLQSQSPETREAVIQGSNVPEMQSNYDQMARKLYEYDKMHLEPKYSQAPSQPSDALSFGRVGASSLAQLTPEMAAGPTTLYADNPKYAVTSQAAQQGSILDLLNSLNEAISKEFTSKRGQYTSRVNQKQTTLDNILGYLDRAEGREEKEKERAYTRSKDALNYNLELKKLGLQVDPKTGNIINANGAIPTGNAAIAEVLRQGGADFINKVTNPSQKIAIAEDILRLGGVKAYRNEVPLDSLFDDRQRESAKTASDLLFNIDRAAELFGGGDKYGGTGPVAQIFNQEFNPFRSENTKEMTRLVEKVRADYQKLISGVAISEQEAKRLSTFLPTKGKNESTNYGDLKALSNGIKANLELFELGVREGLTPNETYKKYGKQILEKYGASETESENLGKVQMISPDGRSFEVDSSEVSEAESNGWRRK